MFGDREEALSSDLNPAWTVRKLKEEGKELPSLYLSCGEHPQRQSLLCLGFLLVGFLTAFLVVALSHLL